MMIPSRPRTALLAVCLSLLVVPELASAQGATGGSLGNDNKSLSGSREAAPARRARPERAERIERRAPTPRRSNGGNFDGAWTVVASGGCAVSGTSTVMISGGRVYAQGLSGSVSPSGAVRTVGSSGGLTIISTGRISGNTGYGAYRQSDGCSGTLRAIRN